jgi:Rap1a immunity proteins
MRSLCLLAFLLALGAHNACASTGNSWKAECDQPNDALQVGFCMARIEGVVEGLGTGLQTPQRSLPFCIPDGVTNFQIKDIVYKYIIDHPEQRQFHLSEIALYALIAAFPRPKAGCR